MAGNVTNVTTAERLKSNNHSQSMVRKAGNVTTAERFNPNSRSSICGKKCNKCYNHRVVKIQ